jgi:hypothetical protein
LGYGHLRGGAGAKKAQYTQEGRHDIQHSFKLQLSGLEPDSKDKDGHTPNECFLRCRNAHCAVTRQPFDVEKRARVKLMSSARGHGEILYEGFDDDDVTVVDDDFTSKRNDSFAFSEASGDSDPEDEFVDAEEH